MSPSETSSHETICSNTPSDAFAYFRKRRASPRWCVEEKHMGSRAVVLIAADPGVLVQRFGLAPDQAPNAGIVLTRRGRRFFADPGTEAAVLDEIRAAVGASGLWAELETDWVLLDAELMPWSAKARSLIDAQYAPVGAAAAASLSAAIEALEGAAGRGQQLPGLLERYRLRQRAALDYDRAWRRYCWDVVGPDDLRLAPFQILAAEGAVHAATGHRWHLELLERLVAASSGPILQATAHRWVRLEDPDAVAAAVAWWEQLTDAGGEGMVIKPADALVWHKRRLVQPALKCRGREYLRIIYGPEYTLPEQLPRLRQRATGRKRSLAEREYLLGLEAMHRFVEGASLHRVHTCIFAILAMEAEAIDPRL